MRIRIPKGGYRYRLTEPEYDDMWRRWRAGESMSAIGRAFGVETCSIRVQLVAHGGITPAPRKRSPHALTLAEREEISRGLARGDSLRAIARTLKRPASTICREVKRNGGSGGPYAAGVRGYRAVRADTIAWRRARRPKRCKMALLPRLQREVARKLALDWSPEQISGWLRIRFPDEPDMHISHEAIYRSIFIQARGVLKKEIAHHLRTRRTMRRARNASQQDGRRSAGIVDAVKISERPAEAEDRAVPGHWEGDLLSGLGHSAIATLVERSSRYTMLVKLGGRDTERVVAAIKKQVTKLPTELRKSLTWDRGTEMGHHKHFTVETDMQVYFCDPQSPWQRGTNENTNGLLRQYLPDGTDMYALTQSELNKVARQLNERPRKTLGFNTPAEHFHSLLR